jgi:hypothetical protein
MLDSMVLQRDSAIMKQASSIWAKMFVNITDFTLIGVTDRFFLLK